jgi:hypothetical protein
MFRLLWNHKFNFRVLNNFYITFKQSQFVIGLFKGKENATYETLRSMKE